MYMYVHSEALLRAMSAVSIVTIEVVLVKLKSKFELKMGATKLYTKLYDYEGQPSVLHELSIIIILICTRPLQYTIEY